MQLHHILGLTATMAFAAAVPAHAQEHGAAPGGRHDTITGTVMDVSCMIGSGASGESHRACAQTCADAGLPLAIMGSDGHVYMALANAPGQSTNAKLKEFAEHRVHVTGTVIEAHGVRGIKIDSVTAAT